MKPLSYDALLWWWSLPETEQLDIEVSCLEEGVDLGDMIYLLSGQVFDDLQRQQERRGGPGGELCGRFTGAPDA